MGMNRSPTLFQPPPPPESRGGLPKLLRKIKLELGFLTQVLTRMSGFHRCQERMLYLLRRSAQVSH